jgi:type IV secretory pathway VirB2 component (pilin)
MKKTKHLILFLIFSYTILFNHFSFASINNKSFTPPPGGNQSTDNDAVGGVLTKVSCSLTGTWGKAIATIAIVALGIGLFLGKLSWGLAISTAVGVGMIFGAAQITQWLGGTSAIACV